MIEFIDLMAQYRRIKSDIDKNIEAVLKYGKYILGPEVKELEQKLGEYTGAKHVITCSNGTDALLMPLMAWGVGRGDAVFTTPFTFIATAEVISLLGAVPVFVDIDPDTFNIDPNLLESAIKKTISEGNLTPKAIIPVDLFGLPADYDNILRIAEKYGLKVLEDAAQSFGSVYKQKRTGSLCDAVATSFFPAKPLGCYGDGGAIFTGDDHLAEKLFSIRAHGQGNAKYENVRTGINGRLDTLQAAILLVKLNIFNEELISRKRIASRYILLLKDVLKTPVVPDGLESCWAQYSVLAKDDGEREYLRNELKNAGVPTAVYYPVPLHLQKAFSYLGYKKGDFSVSEYVSSRIFSLPMHPYIENETIEKITGVIQSCFSRT
ncbi:MAG: UDP-2-acetamido-2-deoxy-3-oxo-D-glucuronate aminotransferase [Firmicutes bacterium ADurb.Bin182]|nr:MAG: UDP-2-acetamido-2-deoxy-3-oxo-D-glucuronate aminotransferase [Firmicutes bacterium ADurb.Bin182]